MDSKQQKSSNKSRLQRIVEQRWLAYVSEVGESLRPVIPRWTVNTGYAISTAYVLAETAMYKRSLGDNDPYVKEKITHRLLWHSAASMAIPAFTVNRIVHFGKKYTTNRYLPTAFAMAAIPFIIHPIDGVCDAFFERFRIGSKNHPLFNFFYFPKDSTEN